MIKDVLVYYPGHHGYRISITILGWRSVLHQLKEYACGLVSAHGKLKDTFGLTQLTVFFFLFRQDNCEKANLSKRRCRWILGILVLFCFIFAGHYFQWSAFRHSALLSFYFQRQEPKGITGATTLKPTSITSTFQRFFTNVKLDIIDIR